VALSGDTAVVGAVYDDNPGGTNAGSAYVFVRSGTSWGQQTKLTASDAATAQQFGVAVALSGETALVGRTGQGAAFVFGCTGSTALSVPVRASVVPQSGGVPQVAQIGTIAVTAGAGSLIDGRFTLDPSYAYLDHCYDFQWINVVASFTKGGVPQTTSPLSGLLPAIDPPPSDGPEPFYYNASEWSSGMFGGTVIRKEGFFSVFSDSRYSPTSPPEVKEFHCYLVAHDIAAGSIAPHTAGVLAGFAWRYDSPSNDAVICGPLQLGAPVVNAALAAGQSGCPGHAGCPGYAGWVASDGPQLGPCEILKGSPSSISLAPGGVQTLAINASSPNAGFLYLVLGTTSGTAPGLPFGPYTVPLNPDVYFTFALTSPNTPPLLQSLGFLNVAGDATAYLSLPPGTTPSVAGAVLHHAVGAIDLVWGTVAFVSNPVALTLVP
jgi:hypothetical protein